MTVGSSAALKLAFYRKVLPVSASKAERQAYTISNIVGRDLEDPALRQGHICRLRGRQSGSIPLRSIITAIV